ncbi:expressed protein [Echinococcus multilocularis]|uniref:Expressed protein n=1 Tax=Echinococcus multilocularis TaxID=6211 RepID=A0A068YCU6_ECHMU|nr:expressed protein [Echinococcus multilocularis]
MLWRVQLLRTHSNKSPSPTPVCILFNTFPSRLYVCVCFSVCLLTFVSHSHLAIIACIQCHNYTCVN